MQAVTTTQLASTNFPFVKIEFWNKRPPLNKRPPSNKRGPLDCENGRLFESLTKNKKVAKGKYSEQQR